MVDTFSRTRDLPPAIFLMGPTAAGKTSLAIKLVEEFPCDIISVDSAMVYRDMDIGTAKPSPEELARAPHRLVDICDPADPYSAARFQKDALREMTEVTEAGRVPLLVGGTMLYYKALLGGLAPMPKADPALRERLQTELQTQGPERMHRKLAALDPEAAARIHVNDPQRLIRALEVCELSGRSLTSLHEEQENQALPWRPIQVALIPGDRSRLHKLIAERFDAMLAAGFVDEVAELHKRNDLGLELPSIRSVGYRQVWQYLDGDLSLENAVEKARTATRQLAKRQLTWLRSWRDAESFDAFENNLPASIMTFIGRQPGL